MSNIDMNTTDSDFNETGNGISVGKLSIDMIETSDTISQFMEKVNNNFTNILKHGGGPRGVDGGQGHQGVPTKPKVPIHVWKKGEEYLYEKSINGNVFEIDTIKENELSNVKYQEGHLIILENAHVYILENNSNFELTPKFIMALQSYDPGEIVHGKNAYVHFAYADSENGKEGFIVDNQSMDNNLDINTFNLTRQVESINKPYMGIYSDRQIKSSEDPSRYTWVRIQGKDGTNGIQGEQGSKGDGYSVILSNPIAVIPVGVGDNDWIIDEKYKNQSDYTFVYLYNNTSDISTNQNVKLQIPYNKHFSTKKENGTLKVIFTPVVDGEYFDFGSNTQYKLPITLTYNLGEDSDNDDVIDNFTSTINWILSPIKGLEDVEVFVDKRVVNTSVSPIHTFRVGYYLISSNGGRKFIENSNYGNTNEYQIILTDDIEDLSNGILVEDWQNAQYTFVRNDENINCYVVLVDSNNKIIDYTNITSINDGKSSMHLELTQDYILLPSDPATGGLHEKYDINHNPISSKMMLYDGDTLIEDFENITYSFKVNNEDVSGYFVMHKDNNGKENGGFDINDSDRNLIVGDMNIECIATYKNNSFHKTLFIDLEKTPYELEINKNIITRDGDSGAITTDKLAVRVKCWVNGEWKYIGDGDVFLIDSTQQNFSISDKVGDELFTRKITLSDLDIKGSEVRISYIKDHKELSYEIISIISSGKTGEDGKDGTSPSLVKTTIFGYSLSENARIDVDSDWVSSIDELGTLEPCITIYILNKYEWSDGKITRGITVTLSGTQGIDGKSRVLFYLGSYEMGKATLTQAIPTTFNDIRCDYYIDNRGNAWMRKGKTTNGTENGNSAILTIPNGYGLPNENWEASTKVGFLQAGAITADMINTGSLVANTAFVTELFAQKVTANQLSVQAANILGTLTIGSGNGQVKIEDNQITAGMINTDELKVKAANIIGTLTIGNKSIGNSDEGDESFNINTDDIVYSINSESNTTTIDGSKITTGSITSEQINVNELYVKNLRTVTGGYKNSVNISENTMSIYDSNNDLVCSFSDDNINYNTNNAFILVPTVNIDLNRPIIQDQIVQPIDETLNSTGEQSETQFDQSFFYSEDNNDNISQIHRVAEIGTYTHTNEKNFYKYSIDQTIKPTLSLGENLLFTGDIISIKTNLKTTFDFKNILVNDGDTITITRKIFVNVYNSGGIIMKTLYANDGIEVSITTSNDNNEILSIDHGKIEFEDYTIEKNDKYRFSVGVKGMVTVIKSNNSSITDNLFLPYKINDYFKDTESYCEINATIKYNNVVDGDSDITGDSDINNDTKKYITLIGKNGLLVNNNNNGIFIGDDGIILKFKKFGLKLDEYGIHISNTLQEIIPVNESRWTKLTQ